MAEAPGAIGESSGEGHARWVRISHWIVTVSVLTLAFSGFEILMVHPRLYWGEAGNDLTPALVELPISRNYKHGGWDKPTPLFAGRRRAPISASRTYDIFNQNGWGRSLHFLAAWFLVLPGAVYLLAGVFGGHFRSHIWPRARELAPRLVWRDVRRSPAPAHSARPRRPALRPAAEVRVLVRGLRGGAADGGDRPDDVAGGDRRVSDPAAACSAATSPRARSTSSPSSLLVLFVIVHVVMVVKSGFRRQIRAMTVGE